MPKQIKIGLDKVPAPVTKQFTQLVDIEGSKLTDSAGNPIVTEEEATLGSFSSSETALSVFVNNLGTRQAIPVIEQFGETSEVSSSLLGVPRSEEQLALFADVATYGLDEDNWNYYTFSNATYPGEWYNKENPIFGRRSNPTFNEGSEEQALYLKSFPSQYTFPGSTIASKLEGPSDNFKSYMNFIAMGKYLYSIFYSVNPTFADLNFIDDSIYIVDQSDLAVANPPIFLGDSKAFVGNGTYFDVTYGNDLQAAFDKIERWTYFFGLIRNGTDSYPELIGSAVTDFKLASDYLSIRGFCVTECTPGGSSNAENFAILESKKTFRYQPGRASGFTFGVRMQADPSTNANFIEWGCSNDTDEYMFQLRGSQFNIVRRSVIRMPDDLLIRQGLLPSNQSSTAIYPKGVGNSVAMWETVIPRTKFSGDNLLGSGPSGYILSFEDVTMYKIEYSWYGAIGAKFYAYAPAGNGEARWILIHHFIIENGLGVPVLKNPDFKFKYLIYAADTANMASPIFLYKYGSSYYVDGGDEGTIRLTTVTSDTKQFQNRTPVVGILPKQKIFNQDGIGSTNFKKAYPATLAVSSDLACRIDIIEIDGSPDGAHYNYSPSLSNERHPLSRTLNFQYQANNAIDILDGDELILTDDDAKIIADGVYNVYVDYDSDDAHKSTNTRRRNNSHTLVADTVLRSIKSDGAFIDPVLGSTFTGKLSNYHTVTASTVPIQANNFKIHFLNPLARDPDGNNKHFAEFAVAITSFTPELDSLNDNALRFRNYDNVLEAFDKNKVPFVEWTQVGVVFDFSNKAEVAEWDPGYGHRFSVDPRLPNPPGADSGLISAIKGEVRNVDFEVISIDAGEGDFVGQWKITFAGGAPPDNVLDIANQSSEVGVDGVGLDIYYTTLSQLDGSNKYFVYVSGDPTDDGTGTGTRVVTSVQIKTITLRDDWQLISYSDNGELQFTHRNFVSSKAVKFNTQPLYLVFALKDYAKVNNIVVEEITEDTIKTHTPVFIKDAATLTINNSGSSSNILSPSAFNSEERLSSVRFDTSTLNPLRPSTALYSFFVPANKPQRVDLTDIFGRDRKGLARGLLNNKAVFFTASNLDSTGGSGGSLGNVEMTLTVKEQ
jgi:hypothetical protein